MGKPRDQDVVFVEDPVEDADSSHDPFTTPRKQSTTRVSSPPSSETTGNRIYKRLLREYYNRYFDCESNEDSKKQVRKQMLERFYQETSSPDRSQFLLHKQQGKSECFTKVFFKSRIDQKIKESFERMRRNHGTGVDPNDSTPVGVLATPPDRKPLQQKPVIIHEKNEAKAIGVVDSKLDTDRTGTTSLTPLQTAGCRTGERISHSEPFRRKRGRSYLWKEPATTVPRRRQRTEEVQINKSNWGKLREQLFRSVRPSLLKPMDEIEVSPYENNRSAETGEEPFEKWKQLMSPCANGKMNPMVSKLYGDPLAEAIFLAKEEIHSVEYLFETSWKWGKIGKKNLGWIPKRQLLLCLDENTIRAPHCRSKQDSCDDKSDDYSTDTSEEEENDSEMKALRLVARQLDCYKIAIAAMREWKLKYEYPELYSAKDGGEILFVDESQKNCYKCLIFVARVFCTLLLFKQEQSPPPSLMKKVHRCLQIMNRHARAHPTELAKILRKKKHMERGTKRRKRITGTCEERQLTLMASFALVQKESETLLKMMDYYKTRLLLDTTSNDANGDQQMSSFLESMDEEVHANVQREIIREQRFRETLALVDARTKSAL